jgi:YfiH family protein
MFLTSSNLSGIRHGFFTRKGGVSGGIYASLNCGWGSHDDPAHVRENRERVARHFGIAGTQLLSLYQVHGDKVITVESVWARENNPQADAMVTRKPGIAIGVLAADCVPVLFADMKNGVIGAAHAGWKGAFAGVIGQTVNAMLALGADSQTIHAAIGPCIGPKSYEVSTEFREKFLSRDANFTRYFAAGMRPEHFLFDIRAFVRMLLAEAGVDHVNTLENDTYIEEDTFFSFRRTTHKEEPDYGRQISAIMLK